MCKTLFEIDGWQLVKDGDERAFDIFRRHYSFTKYRDNRRMCRNYPNRHLIAGPGEKMILLHSDGALFVWRKFIDKSGQKGVNCAAFRNESNRLSSELILDAEKIARKRWPLDRFYTYVDSKKIKSINAGYCFKKAGWTVCGITKKRKLIILEKVVEGARFV